MEEHKKSTLIITASIIAVALIIGGVILYFSKGSNSGGGNQTSALESQGLSFLGLPLEGSATSTATVLEFGDFQCIACVRFFAAVEPQLRKEFIDNGKANMVFKPLTFIDQFAGKSGNGESWHAAQAVECAADQGKFWQMHDLIYLAEAQEVAQGGNNENSGNLTRDFFVKAAGYLGLDTNQFTSCFDSQKHTGAINGFWDDAQKAMGSNVSTPTVFVIKSGVAQKIQNPFDIKEFGAIING